MFDEEGFSQSNANMAAALRGQPAQSPYFTPEVLATLFLIPRHINRMVTNPNTGQSLYQASPIKAGESGFYDIHNEKGKPVGYSSLQYKPDAKTLYVDYIQAHGDPSTKYDNTKANALNNRAHAFGTKEMRSLFQAVKDTFPGVEKIEGDRISGSKMQKSLGAMMPQRVTIPQKPMSGAPGATLSDLW